MINKDYINEFDSPIRSINGRVELYINSTQHYTFNHFDNLMSIEIDRQGENGKFFGFGVAQTATVKIKDADKAFIIGSGYKTNIFFRINNREYVNNFATFYVDSAKRDENTNVITIELQDKIIESAKYTLDELELAGFRIRDYAAAAANKLGVSLEIRMSNDAIFDTDYPTGANFNGDESLREILNDIAEATQTIYFMAGDTLVFRKLTTPASIDFDTIFTLDKSRYYTLTHEDQKILSGVCHATELGDNVLAGTDRRPQYVRDNGFWEMREDIDIVVGEAYKAVRGMNISPYECKWRGNFLCEIGDEMRFISDVGNQERYVYLLNDKITYNGGYSQTSNWSCDNEDASESNPSSLGAALNKTFAKVDKVNQQIELVASESKDTTDKVAQMGITVEGISASVESTNRDITELNNKVEASITEDGLAIAIQKEIAEGVSKVKTATGFTFDEIGLTVSKEGTEITTTITEDGMTVKKNDEEVLTANNEGVKAIDLHATTFLIIGEFSRLEDFGGNRTGCFWIGN